MIRLNHLVNAVLILWLVGLAAAVTVRLGDQYLALTKRLVFAPIRWFARTVRNVARPVVRHVKRHGRRVMTWLATRLFHRFRRW